jgi:hypothetical protein
MNLKLILRVVFLGALIWLLAALAGAAPGATLRIGDGRKRKRDPRCRGRNANTWVASGMGAEMITTPGTDVPTVGIPLLR